MKFQPLAMHYTVSVSQSISTSLYLSTVDAVQTWTYGGPHILNIICANEIKLCVYDAYVL